MSFPLLVDLEAFSFGHVFESSFNELLAFLILHARIDRKDEFFWRMRIALNI
jgi:hypothetical protein